MACARRRVVAPAWAYGVYTTFVYTVQYACRDRYETSSVCIVDLSLVRSGRGENPEMGERSRHRATRDRSSDAPARATDAREVGRARATVDAARARRFRERKRRNARRANVNMMATTTATATRATRAWSRGNGRRDGNVGRRRCVVRAEARTGATREEAGRDGGRARRATTKRATRGRDARVWASEQDVEPLKPMTADEAEAMAREISRLREEQREGARRLKTAEADSAEGEAQAKAMAEQAVLATEAYEKDDELATSAMKSAQEASKAVVEAVALSDAVAERMRRVEEAVVQARLVPSEDGAEQSDDVLSVVKFKRPNKESDAETLARKMGVLPETSWWDEDDLSLAEASERSKRAFEAADFVRKETQAELTKREAFAEECATKAQRSLQLSLSAHESADQAMEKVASKMQAMVALSESVGALEKEINDKQALIDGVKFDEASVTEMMSAKTKADIKAEAVQELAVKRAEKVEEKEAQEAAEGTDDQSVKKSSKFMPAGYFSTAEQDGPTEETIIKKIFTGLLLLGTATLMLPMPKCKAVRAQIGTSLVRAGSAAKSTTGVLRRGAADIIERVVPASERELAAHAAHEAEETGMSDLLWLLFTSVLAVTIVSKIPGGSPVLGFLVGGALVGPFGLGIIQHVEQVKVLAEFGVVFLLFNIGLELSYDRLVSMAKYIFGLGSSQMMLSTAVGAAVAVACGLAIPPAVIVGLGLAFSSTAVALQVLADRGESASRHGRATFSVLLFQDLTVVLVFMLVPLLAGPDSGSLTAIGGSLLKAVVKTAAAIVSIIGLGRVVLRPVFDRVAKLRQAELMSATTLFVALGTSLLTQSLGLSMALGAFLAGLLLAETEFHLQVENDIAPFRGLLLGLFFMTVGMTIDPMTFTQSAGNIVSMMAAILIGKIAVVAAVGPMFGLSLLNCIRAGMYIGPGGEFAFVTFAEAVRVGLFSPDLATQLNLAVVLTMAITPYLAEVGNSMKDVWKSGNVATLQPKENEVDDLKGHVILAGYGRNGKIIGEILSANMIPFVALDVNPEIVSEGRAADQNVYFGDAGSPEVLRAIGAARASCAIVALSSPAANYRAVWSLTKNFSNIHTYVRAEGVEGGLILEKAGAKAVVPEALEPSLQLAAACLREQKMSPQDISVAIDNYRRSHLKSLSSRKFSADYSSVNYGGVGQSLDMSSTDEAEVASA